MMTLKEALLELLKNPNHLGVARNDMEGIVSISANNLLTYIDYDSDLNVIYEICEYIPSLEDITCDYWYIVGKPTIKEILTVTQYKGMIN